MPALNELKETKNNVEIIWRAFELRPAPAPLPEAKSDYFKTMWQEHLYPLAEKLNVKMKMPEIKPYSRITHEAAKWAASVGNFEQFKTAVFRAYFERGENIGEIKTLLDIADQLEMNAESLKKSLKENEFLEDVLRDENYAAEIGINSVPTFIADRKNGLSGLQSAENLSRLIRSV